MKVVKIKGGLGNQMFQYAFAKLLERSSNEIVKLDFSYFETINVEDNIRVPRILKMNISLEKAKDTELDSMWIFRNKYNSKSFWYKLHTYIESKINNKYYKEVDRRYIKISEILPRSYYDGYWQSWKYLDEIKLDLQTDFAPRESLSEDTRLMVEEIRSKNSVFVGVRRGDYITSALARKRYGSFSIDYYRQGMKQISENIENPVFYIFSDDIKWVKENMDFSGFDTIYRDEEIQTDDFEELMLMSACKHAVIVNSTFQFWGAWLINNKNKIVIAPKKWFFDDYPIDIIPPTWCKIEN